MLKFMKCIIIIGTLITMTSCSKEDTRIIKENNIKTNNHTSIIEKDEEYYKVTYPELYWDILSYNYNVETFNEDGTISEDYIKTDPFIKSSNEIIFEDDNVVIISFSKNFINDSIKARKSYIDEMINNINDKKVYAPTINKIIMDENNYNNFDLYIDISIIESMNEFSSTIDNILFNAYAIQLFDIENNDNYVQLNIYNIDGNLIEEIDMDNYFIKVEVSKDMIKFMEEINSVEKNQFINHIGIDEMVYDENENIETKISKSKYVYLKEYYYQNFNKVVDELKLNNQLFKSIKNIISDDELKNIDIYIDNEKFEEEHELIKVYIQFYSSLYHIFNNQDEHWNINYYDNKTDDIITSDQLNIM